MWEYPVLTDWDSVSPLNSYTFVDPPQGRGVVAGGYLVMPVSGVAFLATYNLSTNVTSTATVAPAVVTDLFQWGEFTLAWNGSTNRLYYSAPANPLSWSSANYYDIGKPGDRILTCAVSLGTLYVGTEGAWFALSGVPGASLSIRQITYTGASSAYSTPDLNGIVYAGGYNGHTPVAVLAGSRLQPAIFASSSATTTATVYGADQYIVADPDINGETIYVRSPEGAWWRLSAQSLRQFPADRSIYFESQSRLYYAAGTSVWRQKLDVSDPPLDVAGTSFQSASVLLADYQANRPFRVDEVIVELSLGVTAANSQRVVRCGDDQRPRRSVVHHRVLGQRLGHADVPHARDGAGDRRRTGHRPVPSQQRRPVVHGSAAHHARGRQVAPGHHAVFGGMTWPASSVSQIGGSRRSAAPTAPTPTTSVPASTSATSSWKGSWTTPTRWRTSPPTAGSGTRPRRPRCRSRRSSCRCAATTRRSSPACSTWTPAPPCSPASCS
jgi:hypothetical protein